MGTVLFCLETKKDRPHFVSGQIYLIFTGSCIWFLPGNDELVGNLIGG